MKMKKLISVFLAVVMIASCCLTVMASAADRLYSMDCPNIYVPGFMSSTIYKNPGTAEQEAVWPPSSESIISAVKNCIPAIGKLALTQDWDAFADVLLPEVEALFEPSYLDNNGEASNNTGVDFEWPAANTITKNSLLTFKYDWRLSPIEIASQLNDYVEYVLKCSGCDKATFTAHSYGGIVMLSYITLYGDDKVEGVVFDSTAIYGETYTGELLTGQIKLSTDSVQSFLEFALDDSEYENTINTIIAMLRKGGVLDFVMAMGNTLIANIEDRAIEEVLLPFFGRWPTIWAMSPDEYIDDAMKFVFDDVCAESKADYSGLIAKIEDYNNRVRPYKTETLKEIEATRPMGVISGYGYSAVPITPSWDVVGDGVVDTKSTSFGATVAPYGKTLDSEYLENADPKYISPEKSVDASTCLFPDKTWFVRDLKHSSGHDSLGKLFAAILYSEDEEITVSSLEEYPQFLKFNAEDETVSANTQTRVTTDLMQRFIGAIREFIMLLVKLIKSIGA